jgi:AbiU2
VALGRVFDPNPMNHSVTRLLSFAHAHLDIFSKASLAARKSQGSADANTWLPQYLKSVYEPNSDDFKALRTHVAKRRKFYESNYRPLRHKVIAHRGVDTRVEVNALFAMTNRREMQKLLVFLGRLYQVLWELYFNGRKPTLAPARFSVKRMLEQPSPNYKRQDLQERLVRETKTFLAAHAREA